MAKGFDPEFMRELKYKNDLVEVASGYMTLEKKGANYWACCPFHHEKTPSFSINGAEGFYHCFGCGVSGDVISFVKEIESVDFMEAVRILADRAKIAMPETNTNMEETVRRKQKKDELLKILRGSAVFYRANLYSGNAAPHVQYIRDRKMTDKTVRVFGLGASLDYRSLPQYLLDKGFQKEDMLQCGVVQESRTGELIDAQAGRLIYPIIDYMDNVIAFGGRILEKKDFAKYKNTKETPLFNKSRTLYNVNLLKKLKKTQNIGYVIMVEGYMDTISLYQAGFKNVVASMGTSLTMEQVRLLKRYSGNVYISYDGDFAGQKANSRGLEILKSEGMNVRVVPLPDGLDPDDVVKESGAEGYRKCLDAAMPLIDYKLSYAARGKDLTKAEDKRAYIASALNIIRESETQSEREDLLRILRDRTGVTYESLRRDLENLPAVPAVTGEQEKRKRPDAASRLVKAERFILACVLFDSPFARDYVPGMVDFTEPEHRVIADYIEKCWNAGEKPNAGTLFELFEEESPALDEILNLNYADNLRSAEGERYYNDSIRVLMAEKINKQIEILTQAALVATDAEERKMIHEQIQSYWEVKNSLKS